MTPIERAARALYDVWPKVFPDLRPAVGIPFNWERKSKKEAYREAARAVLTAIREPSEAILKAMRDTVPVDGLEWEYVETDAVDHWKAMIDAALAEEG